MPMSSSDAVERLLRGRVGPDPMSLLTEQVREWLANTVRATFTRPGSAACRFA